MFLKYYVFVGMGSSACNITFNFIAINLRKPSWMITHWLLVLCITYIQFEIFSLKNE